MEKKLQNLLAKLNAEIDKIDVNDSTSRVKLEELSQQINAKLQNTDSSEPRNKLITKLQESAINFKDEHPMIAANIEEMIDILVKLGL